MNELAHEQNRQPELSEIVDDIVTRFETDGVVDVSQISAFMDNALTRLRTAHGVHIYRSGFNPAAIPDHLAGVQIIEPDSSRHELDQTTELRLTSTGTSLSLSRSSEYVHISVSMDLTTEDGEAVSRNILVSLGASNSAVGGIVVLSENTAPLAYELLTNDGQIKNPSMRPTVESALEYLKWAAEHIETMPVGSPIYHG